MLSYVFEAQVIAMEEKIEENKGGNVTYRSASQFAYRVFFGLLGGISKKDICFCEFAL